MINDLAVVRIANAIEMDNTYPGVFLIVEGQRDSLFFSKFTKQENVKLYIAHGKEKVTNSIVELNQRTFKKALGIIDRDFNDIRGIDINISNLIVTDFHDIEIAIINSPAFDVVLNAHGNPQKIKKITELLNADLAKIFFSLSENLGKLKLANEIHDLGLVFKPELPEGKPISYSNFINFSDLTFASAEELINTIINYSRNRTRPKSFDFISEKYNEIDAKAPYDFKHLCNGHDFTFIFQLALKKAVGSISPSECSHSRIELDLIFAYDSTYFMTTNLYKCIKDWERRTSFKVLEI